MRYIVGVRHGECRKQEMVSFMKSVLIGGIAAIVIAIAAGAVLNSMNPTAGQKYSTSSTRLN